MRNAELSHMLTLASFHQSTDTIAARAVWLAFVVVEAEVQERLGGLGPAPLWFHVRPHELV